jgi:hypothetical protein
VLLVLLFLLQVMGKSKVLVKVHPEGKYVVDIDKEIDIADLTPGETSEGTSRQAPQLLPCSKRQVCSQLHLLGVQDKFFLGVQGTGRKSKWVYLWAQ